MLVNKSHVNERLSRAGLKEQAHAFMDEVRTRVGEERGGKRRNRKEVTAIAWEQMWEVFKPAVEKRELQLKQQDNPCQMIEGLPDRTTDDILDPEYHERDRGKQIRDGVLWAAMEFDRVIQDTPDGPIAHLDDASVPPPNAFAIGTLRTYALSPIEKRRDLIARALAFASKAHDNYLAKRGDNKGFLHELM
jgi:hypothetical protein